MWIRFWLPGDREHMQNLAYILIIFAVALVIAWLAVFFNAIASKRRGTMPRFFSGGRAGHSRGPRPHVAWWKHLLFLPLYLILLFAIGVGCLILLPPMFVVEKLIYKE